MGEGVGLLELPAVCSKYSKADTTAPKKRGGGEVVVCDYLRIAELDGV